MTKPTLRPALISVDGDKIQALDLVAVGDSLAVPVDQGYRTIGYVFQDRITLDGLNPLRWFATTMVESHLGPFTAKALAVKALVEWNHLRAADVQETSAPLF